MMLISNLILENYRSFDEDGVSISFKEDINIIVGRNNVGKSNILYALEYMSKLINNTSTVYKEEQNTDSHPFETFDKHNNSGDIPSIEIEIVLENEDISNIVNSIVPHDYGHGNVDDITNALENCLTANFSIINYSISNKNYCFLKVFDIYINENGACMSIEPLLNKYGSKHLKNFRDLDYALLSNSYDFEELFDGIVQNTRSKDVIVPEFSGFYFYIRDKFSQSLKIFNDIRYKPTWKNEEVFISLDGEKIIDVLFNFKNSKEPRERQIYEDIRSVFNEIYPDLSIIAVKGDVHIKKISTNFEVPLKSCGTGLIEMTIFLTNIISSKNSIIGIEEPENHLHPKAQKVLFDYFQKYSENNQFIIVTHSPYFISPSYINNIIMVSQNDGLVKISQPSKRFFPKKELRNLEKTIDDNCKDIFFSKLVFLTEGLTELGSLPIFYSMIGHDFNKESIKIIGVGGKNNFKPYMKICKGFKIPYIIMCDYDAVMEIESKNLPSMIRQLKELSLIQKSTIQKKIDFKVINVTAN